MSSEDERIFEAALSELCAGALEGSQTKVRKLRQQFLDGVFGKEDIVARLLLLVESQEAGVQENVRQAVVRESRASDAACGSMDLNDLLSPTFSLPVEIVPTQGGAETFSGDNLVDSPLSAPQKTPVGIKRGFAPQNTPADEDGSSDCSDYWDRPPDYYKKTRCHSRRRRKGASSVKIGDDWMNVDGFRLNGESQISFSLARSEEMPEWKNVVQKMEGEPRRKKRRKGEADCSSAPGSLFPAEILEPVAMLGDLLPNSLEDNEVYLSVMERMLDAGDKNLAEARAGGILTQVAGEFVCDERTPLLERTTSALTTGVNRGRTAPRRKEEPVVGTPHLADAWIAPVSAPKKPRRQRTLLEMFKNK